MIVNASSFPSERKTANYLLVMSDDIVAGAAKKIEILFLDSI